MTVTQDDNNWDSLKDLPALDVMDEANGNDTLIDSIYSYYQLSFLSHLSMFEAPKQRDH